MSLSGHLRELKNRLFWSGLFVIAGTVVGWFLFDPVFEQLQAPIERVAAEAGVNATVNFGTVVSAFDLRLQVSIFLGIMLTSPVWLFNLWAFITPGLKQKERRYTLGFLFSAVPLFLLGAAAAWYSLPGFVRTLISFTPEGSSNIINAAEYILFTIRILLIFGIAFVLPVVLVLLNFASLLSAKSIFKSWRIAVFVIAVIAALVTSTADPMSMFLVMLPLLLLYFLAGGIAQLNDSRRARKLAKLVEAD